MVNQNSGTAVQAFTRHLTRLGYESFLRTANDTILLLRESILFTDRYSQIRKM